MFNFTAAINSQIKSEYNNQVAILDEARADAEAWDQFSQYCSTLKPIVNISNSDYFTSLFNINTYRNNSLNNILDMNYTIEDIIGGLADICRAYQDVIEEHLYNYKSYYPDYAECVVNLCNTLTVDVVPQHHDLKYTYIRNTKSYNYAVSRLEDDTNTTNIIEFITSFIHNIINHTKGTLYNDELCEGGYIFEECLNNLNIDLDAHNINSDVYDMFRDVVYYAGCVYADGGLV